MPKNAEAQNGEEKMIMREYRSDDLEQVMAIANAAWQPIRKMSREALGNTIADLLNPTGDATAKGFQVKAQIDSRQYGIAICEHDEQIVGSRSIFLNFEAAGVDYILQKTDNHGVKKGQCMKSFTHLPVPSTTIFSTLLPYSTKLSKASLSLSCPLSVS